MKHEPTTNAELAGAALKAAEDNHIWINAFRLIRPSPEMYQEIGKMVVEMMKRRENLLPAYFGDPTGEITEMQKLTPMLYMSINAS